jgi:plasmid stabilization system protein ParE
VPDWHWEPVTDDLLDELPPAALAAVDGRDFTGEPPGLRAVQRGPLMLVYLTDVRGERVVIIQVNWIG